MIKVQATTKVYAFCKAKYVTGGTELLHQLVDLLNNNGIDAYIHYDEDSPIPERFLKYNIKVATQVDDREENVIVLPEAKIYECKSFKKAKLVFWWLSVDNFYGGNLYNLSLSDVLKWNKGLFVKALLGKFYYALYPSRLPSKNKITMSSLAAMDAINLYQSHYAKDHLQKRNFRNIERLSDYLNKELITTLEPAKSDIVIYNPKKGLGFTKKIIARLKDKVEFVALEKFNNEQLKSYFQKAKLYIDFGSHPGKDRMPREAAINHCCIITSKNGSANFYEDIPILDLYKFDDNDASLPAIEQLILDVLANYEIHKPNFRGYREMIANEENVFEMDAARVFGFNLPSKPQ